MPRLRQAHPRERRDHQQHKGRDQEAQQNQISGTVAHEPSPDAGECRGPKYKSDHRSNRERNVDALRSSSGDLGSHSRNPSAPADSALKLDAKSCSALFNVSMDTSAAASQRVIDANTRVYFPCPLGSTAAWRSVLTQCVPRLKAML